MSNQPFERAAMGADRAEAIKNLALINVIATSLKLSMEPLTQEDLNAGAEPLTADQIQESMDEICDLVTVIALQQLKAEPEEWISANDQIE